MESLYLHCDLLHIAVWEGEVGIILSLITEKDVLEQQRQLSFNSGTAWCRDSDNLDSLGWMRLCNASVGVCGSSSSR